MKKVTAVGKRLVPPCKRRVTYRLYPTASQARRLEEMTRLHAELYNAAIQERRDAWRKQRRIVSFFEQSRQLPSIKEVRAELRSLGAHALQGTLRRVDRAFEQYFRLLRGGRPAGYPRFRASRRYPGWTYGSPSGWRFREGQRGRNGWLQVASVGWIQARGTPRQVGHLKTCTISRRRAGWFASIVVEVHPARRCGKEMVGFDWGVAAFLTFHDGSRVPNPRFLERDKSALVALHRAVSRRRRGSENRRRAIARLARAHRRVARRRANFLHQESARLVARARLIATERFPVANLTRSARGTMARPGRSVRQKAAGNSRILDVAPSTFLAMVRYKAAEAGATVVEVPARRTRPSQTCPACGAVRRKALAQRWHRCPCGCVLGRDHAAALVCLNYALHGVGNRPRVEEGDRSPGKHEAATG